MNLNWPVIVVGATASGKSSFAHRIAEKLLAAGKSVQLLNLDAFQFYRGFDIGTAKPTLQEQEHYRYSFIDVLSPHENWGAHEFAEMARERISDAQRRGDFVIAVGGSGLYLRSLVHGLDLLPGRNEKIREFVRDVASTQGRETVYSWLKALDPIRAGQLHPRDLVRVERALEIYFELGQPASEVMQRQAQPLQQQRLFPCCVVHVALESSELRCRIAERTKSLIHQGWESEVRELLNEFGETFFELPASRAIGYRELAQNVVDGLPTGGDLLERLITLTQRYAKRQRTWLGSALIDVTLSSQDEQERFIERAGGVS